MSYDADPTAYYTLLMVDPDAPSRNHPMFEWRHWEVMNIPGSDVSKGETIAPYKGAGPPKGTNYHRYAFLVYKQPQGLINDISPRLTQAIQLLIYNFIE